MALEIMSEVTDYSRARGKTFLVLLMMANNANPEDRTVRVHPENYAASCHISRRSVYRALNKLLELGEIVLVDYFTPDPVLYPLTYVYRIARLEGETDAAQQ